MNEVTLTDPVFIIMEGDVQAVEPVLVGSERWEVGGYVIKYEGDEWAALEIRKALAQAARIEALRRAQATLDHCLIVQRADEICQEVYGVPLAQTSNLGHVHMKALFLMAQREITREGEGR